MKKYNFMLPLRIREEKCVHSVSGEAQHIWVPTGMVKAMPGEHYSADFHCDRCDKRYSEIFDRDRFNTVVKDVIEGIRNE